MSEQTPEAAMDASEPTMEDILASIRKIIADDDAPADVMAEELPLGRATDNIGDISELVSLHSEPVEAEPVEAEPVEAEPELEFLALNDSPVDTALEDDMMSGDVLADLMVDMPLAEEISDVVEPEAKLIEPELVEANIVENESFVDFDLNAELLGLNDLEIPTPMPEPIESVLSESALAEPLTRSDDLDMSNLLDEVITRPGVGMPEMGVPEIDVPKIDMNLAGGIAAVGATAVAGIAAVSAPEDTLPEDTLPDAGALDDVDAELSALFDTDLTLDDADEIAPALEMPVFEAPAEVALADDIDLTDEVNLDADLTALLDDLTPEEAVAEETIAEVLEPVDSVEPDAEFEAVSDQELNSILDDMEFDTEGFEQDITPDLSTVAAAGAAGAGAALVAASLGDSISEPETSEEDADLVLVKSLMAELSDYSASDETDSGEDDAADELAKLDEVLEDENLEFESIADELDELDELDEQINEAALLSDIPDEITSAEDKALLDDILNIALEDELKSATLADDVAVSELENITENAAFEDVDMDALDLDIDALLADVPEVIEETIQDTIEAPVQAAIETAYEADSASFSLTDIAAAAQADADATAGILSTENIGIGAVIAGAGSAAVVASQITGDTTDDDLHELTQFDENRTLETRAPVIVVEDDVDQMLSNLLDGEADLDDEAFDIENLTSEETNETAIASPEASHEIEITEETTHMPRAAAKNQDVIMDEVKGAATSSVFAELTQAVEHKAVSAERGDRVGDLVMELLQPMLKEWLDKNLKGIVERAVTKEVKRISSGK